MTRSVEHPGLDVEFDAEVPCPFCDDRKITMHLKARWDPDFDTYSMRLTFTRLQLTEHHFSEHATEPVKDSS